MQSSHMTLMVEIGDLTGVKGKFPTLLSLGHVD